MSLESVRIGDKLVVLGVNSGSRENQTHPTVSPVAVLGTQNQRDLENASELENRISAMAYPHVRSTSMSFITSFRQPGVSVLAYMHIRI